MSSTDGHSRRWRSNRMRSVRAAFVRIAARMSSGGANASGGGPRPSMTTSHRTSSGNAPASPIAWPAAERVRDHADRSPDDVAHEQREVEVQQRPREARVERPAVAVTTKVERDRVVTERRDAWREVVEHAAMVVRTVEQQHRRCGRVTPTPQPQLRPIDGDELRRDQAHGASKPRSRSPTCGFA